MATVILTLHYPKGMRGLPIATTTDAQVLRYFKQAVLEEWRERAESSVDEIEALIKRLEYQRLRRILDAVIPEPGLGAEGSEAENESEQ